MGAGRKFRLAEISKAAQSEERPNFQAAGGGPEQFSKLLEMLNFQDFQNCLEILLLLHLYWETKKMSFKAII